MMKRPAPNCSADGRQRLRTGGGQEARKGLTSPPQRFPRSERKPEKVERLVRKVATAVRILAGDDLRLLGMQHQLAGRKATSAIAAAGSTARASGRFRKTRPAFWLLPRSAGTVVGIVLALARAEAQPLR